MTIMSVQDLVPPPGLNWRLSPYRKIRTPLELRMARDKPVTMPDITREIAAKYDLKIEDLYGDRRFKLLCWARYEIWHRIRAEVRMANGGKVPIAAIGRHFHRDHTTILAGLKKYQAWLDGQAAS